MKRAIIIGIMAVTLAIVVVVLFAQRPIGQYVFEQQVAERVGVDRSAALPDGLHVYVCGSGSPMPDPNRAGPCLAILAGRTGLIFDAGSGSARKLGPMGFAWADLNAVFLTHLHSDHFDGLGETMLQAWIAGQSDTPLPVYGPPGTEQVVEGLNQAYTIDSGYRIAHHGTEVANPDGFGASAQVIEASDAERDRVVFSNEDVRVTVLPVDHSPIDNAYAYRIEYGGRSIVISGDTVYQERLAAFAQGADVLFHEALNMEMVEQIGQALKDRGNASGAQIMTDILDYHTSPEDAARAADTAGVGTLILYHLVPAPPVSLIEPAFLGNAQDVFGGEIKLARDGMLITLPRTDEESANGREITFDQLL